MKYDEIDHSSHPHRLVLKPTQTPYRCNGCRELGFKECYQCENKKCNFHLHEECATAASSAFHPFFKTCDFRFFEIPPGECDRCCDACGNDVEGYVYHCLHKHAYDLHPCCVKLPHSLEGDGVELQLRKKAPYKCLKCRSKKISKNMNGWAYVSNSTNGKYCYHVACAKEIFVENWKKGYFRQQSHGIEPTSLALQSMVPSQEVVTQGGESLTRRKPNKYWTMAKLVLKLIISAIFGDPIGSLIAIAESYSEQDTVSCWGLSC